MKSKPNNAIKLNEAQKKAYLKAIAAKFSGKVFFPEKVAWARELLKKVQFPPQENQPR